MRELRCPVCGLGIYEKRGEGVYEAFQRNYCRAFLVLPLVEERPGLTAWELSYQSGIPYADVSKGLQKARDMRLVRTREEQREQGGIRYRHWIGDLERIEDIRGDHAPVPTLSRRQGGSSGGRDNEG